MQPISIYITRNKIQNLIQSIDNNNKLLLHPLIRKDVARYHNGATTDRKVKLYCNHGTDTNNNCTKY